MDMNHAGERQNAAHTCVIKAFSDMIMKRDGAAASYFFS